MGVKLLHEDDLLVFLAVGQPQVPLWECLKSTPRCVLEWGQWNSEVTGGKRDCKACWDKLAKDPHVLGLVLYFAHHKEHSLENTGGSWSQQGISLMQEWSASQP